MDFSEDDLRRAFDAAFEAGMRTPAEMKIFVTAWMRAHDASLFHIEVWQSEADKAAHRLCVSVSSRSESQTRH